MAMIVTMTDGTQYLMHHGVKDMHWGVWNDETKRKYGVYTSPKGDKLKAKADRKRLEAERARTDTAVMNKAAKVHANEITAAYAKANAHRLKGQAKESRSKSVQLKAEAERRSGNDKKADRLEKKSLKLSQKAEREKDASKRESDKGHAASNRIERHNIAVREMDAKAAKLDAKAAKLEARADKADTKQDRKVAKAADELRTAAKTQYEAKVSQTNIDKTNNLSIKAENYLKATNDPAYQALKRTPVLMRFAFGADQPTQKGRERQIEYANRLAEVSRHSITEAAAISKYGQAEVDTAIEKAFGNKRMYRY